MIFRRKTVQREEEGRLEERIEKLERTVRGLTLEWEDTYAKLARLAGRVAKIKAIDQPRDPEGIPDLPAPLRRSDLLKRRHHDTHGYDPGLSSR